MENVNVNAIEFQNPANLPTLEANTAMSALFGGDEPGEDDGNNEYPVGGPPSTTSVEIMGMNIPVEFVVIGAIATVLLGFMGANKISKQFPEENIAKIEK